MRIAYVCSDVDVPVFGSEGCSIHLRSLTRAFAARGHDVTLLCAWRGEGDETALPARVREVAAGGGGALAWEAVEAEPLVADHHLDRDLRSVAFNEWLLDAMRGERFDLVYERYALFGWAGLAAARRLGVPHVLEVNAPLVQEQMGYERFTLTTAAERIERHVVAGTDAVVAVSPWLRDWAIARGARPPAVHVVPNGVDADLFAAVPDAAGARAAYRLTDRRVVGYVGSFQSWHHLRGLSAAFATLAREDESLHLLLVGDGPERAATAERLRGLGVDGAVTFTGALDHHEAPGAMAAMDVVVVPYAAREDFYFSPLKLFEAMAAGRPTVAADVGQIADVVDHGRTGWLYPAGDDDALAACLRAVLADPASAEAVGRTARRDALSTRTWSTVADRIVGMAAA